MSSSGRAPCCDSSGDPLTEARTLVGSRPEPEFRQGLGWYWIIRADLAHAGLLPATPEETAWFAAADREAEARYTAMADAAAQG
jgi:hypothetical protein